MLPRSIFNKTQLYKSKHHNIDRAYMHKQSIIPNEVPSTEEFEEAKKDKAIHTCTQRTSLPANFNTIKN